MTLFDLPNEIGTLIFTFLDTKSKINVYVINELKKFFAPRLVSKIDISRSTLATIKTLNLGLFQDMAVNILELNVSAIKDLTAKQLAPFIRKCNNLKTLDVTFTRIFLSDLEEIYCNSLKNIGINFFKPHVYKARPSIEFRGPHKDYAWMNISELFKKQKFDAVHFILLEFQTSALPLKFMEGLPLTRYLKITLADHCRHCWSRSCEEYVPFSDFTTSYYTNFINLSYIYYHFHKTSHQPSDWLGGISNLNYAQTEYIFIMYSKGIIKIYVSPQLSTIFEINCCCNEVVNICPHLSLNFKVSGNIVFKAWNKNQTVFDHGFFNNLLHELIHYFPTYVCMHTKTNTHITEAPSDWYCIDSCDVIDGTIENVPNNVTLTDICRNGYMSEWSSSITQKPEIELFENITFLSIRDVFLKDNFFANVFSKCKMLYTLDVCIQNCDSLGVGKDSILSLLTNLYQTKLRNLKLNIKDIEYQNMFHSFSQCPTLENIHLCDRDHQNKYESSNKDILLFLEKCCNLYSLFIEAAMEEHIIETLEYHLTNVARKLVRDHLQIVVCYYGSTWNPFSDLFSPSPLDISQ